MSAYSEISGNVLLAHNLGDDGEAGGRARLGEQLQPFHLHALEVVGGSAGLEGAAAQDLPTHRSHELRRFHNLLLALHRARSRHDHELVAANGNAVDRDLGALLLEFPAHEFEGRGDAHGAGDAGGHFNRFQAVADVAHSDHANDHALFTLNGVHFVSKLPDALANVIDLFLRCIRFHGNDHRCLPPLK